MTLTDKFSLERVAMLWRYYTPGMASHLLLTAGLSLLCYLIALLSVKIHDGLGLYSVAAWLRMFGYYCGPLHFARFRDRNFSLQLPATPGERTFIMLFYVMVVVPAVIAVTWYASVGVASMFTDNASVLPVVTELINAEAKVDGISLNLNDLTGTMPLQYLQNATVVFVCLLCVVLSRRSPVTNGIIGIIVSLVAMSVIGGIVGIIVVLSSDCFMEAARNDNAEGVVESVKSMVYLSLYVTTILSMIAFVYTAVRLHRIFRHQQS